MDLGDLILNFLEKKGLKTPPIRVEYERVAKDKLEVIRYHARTGKEMYKRYFLRIVPHETH